MDLLQGHQPHVSYANKLPRTAASRGTVNDKEPTPPRGLSPSEAYRWTTGHRHLEAAKATDINALDPAGRARHFARLTVTIDDLLRLTEELSRRTKRPNEGSQDMF
jgi:hypothetical protein